MTRSSLFSPAVLFFAACSDIGIHSIGGVDAGTAPDIRVDPPSLTWGTLTTGEEEVQTFVITNLGGTALAVTDVQVGAGLGFSVVTEDREFLLDPGASTTIEVAFTPMAANENFGRVIVFSDDFDTPEAPVDLAGSGDVPELQITPVDYVFGEALVPCGGSVPVELRNVGVEDLTITALDYDSLGFLTLDASMLTLPVTLAPGDAREVEVSFAAVTVGADLGTLAVTSNDPRGVVEAWQNGEGFWESVESETFTEPGMPPVDVMMLIDQSCSMEADNTDDVELGMPGFVATLQAVADWQLVQITDDSGCANQGVLDGTVSGAEQMLIDDAFGLADPLQYNGVYRTESLLELASMALAQTGPGDCNEGFVRRGALLHLVVISDEPEQSEIAPDMWISNYETYTVSPDFVRVSSIVDLQALCGEGPAGYTEAADLTGGAKLDICTPSWGDDFSDIATTIADGVRSYNLAQEPDPASVTVVVNGVPTTGFLVVGANVTITSPPVGSGDVVEIGYGAFAECPS